MIKKAIYSHWSCQGAITSRVSNWTHPKYCLYSLVLSVMKSADQFERVDLYTDKLSYEPIKALKLPFDALTIDLENIRTYPKTFWGLPKVHAYSLQDEPFIHIDTDVIINGKLSNKFLNSKLGCQDIDKDARFLNYKHLLALLQLSGGVVPDNFYDLKFSHNLGIYACNDLDFNSEFVSAAYDFIDDNRNLMINNHDHLWSIVFEQYVFSYVVNKNKMSVTNVLDNKKDSEKYWHIWGDKHTQVVLDGIELQVKENYPIQYEIINKMIK